MTALTCWLIFGLNCRDRALWPPAAKRRVPERRLEVSAEVLPHQVLATSNLRFFFGAEKFGSLVVINSH